MAVADEITALLSTTRGGHKLGAGLIEAVVKYLVGVALVKDVNEVNLNDLKGVATEAFEETNPGNGLPGAPLS